MFALAAAVLCALAAFGVDPDGVDLFQLGVALAFLHLAVSIPLSLTRQ